MNEQESYCSNCGHKLGPGAEFCSECGQRVAQPQVQQQQPQPSQQPATPAQPQQQPQAASSSNPAIWIGVGIFAFLVIVLVIAAVGGLWLFSARAPQTSQPATVETTEQPTEAEVATVPATTEEAATPAATVTPAPAAPVAAPVPAPPAQVTVPNVIGLSSGDAADRLANIGGFQIIYNPSRYSDQYAKGAIIAQNPRGGAVVRPGDVVYIVEGLGPAPAPPPRRVAAPKPRRTVSGGQGELAAYTRTRRVTNGDLNYRSNWECTLIRNEIYARHGRPFNNRQIRAWFMGQSWYQPTSNFSESWLSSVEKRNAEFIANYQKRTYGTPATRP